MKKPVCLIIRDGWGRGINNDNNGIYLANPSFANMIENNYPTTLIKTSGLDVGLPNGIMGNSEAGHLNIGAGRVVYQSLTRINLAIEDGSFQTNSALLDAINYAKNNNANVHIMGLVQDAGVHATTDHALEIVKVCVAHGIKNLLIHAFTDGRDTPTHSGLNHLKYLDDNLKSIGLGRIATIVGRYYAMDRDNRLERTEAAYNLITKGIGKQFNNMVDAMNSAYDTGETDEFIKPININYDGIKEEDVVIFFNYRPDRARQLTKMMTDNLNLKFVAMTDYYQDGKYQVMFPEQEIVNNLGEVLSKNNLLQLRCAETEKYAHVTYYFNSLEETPYSGEERILVPSPKVATYDLQPEMSAYELTDVMISAIQSNKYDVIICNFANGDMVGHTGVKDAIIKAVSVVDECSKKIYDEVKKQDGVIIFTADHGNAEQMRYENGEAMTSHTLNEVPLTIIGLDNIKLNRGRLADIAPTILDILKIDKPVEMTGNSLIVKM